MTRVFEVHSIFTPFISLRLFCLLVQFSKQPKLFFITKERCVQRQIQGQRHESKITGAKKYILRVP